jgi:hypothetical protein
MNKFLISYDQYGNPRPTSYTYRDPIQKENSKWNDILIYDGITYFKIPRISFVSDITGKHYTMFLSDFDRFMKEQGMTGKAIQGSFTYVKKGVGIAVQLIGPINPDLEEGES